MHKLCIACAPMTMVDTLRLYMCTAGIYLSAQDLKSAAGNYAQYITFASLLMHACNVCECTCSGVFN